MFTAHSIFSGRGPVSKEGKGGRGLPRKGELCVAVQMMERERGRQQPKGWIRAGEMRKGGARGQAALMAGPCPDWTFPFPSKREFGFPR